MVASTILAASATSVNAAPEKQTSQPKVVEYTVKEGDYLDKIAQEYKTTWNRIFNKNGSIVNPDLVFVGDKIVIPAPDEELAERTFAPVAVPQPVAQENVSSALSTPSSPVVPNRAAVAGNAYAYGYCTWYVKNMRPDIGNYWGDGWNWYSAAQAEGYAVGSAPAPGAIGVAVGYNHVVYVHSVNANGTVNISEMNYEGWNVASSRTASASEFRYVY